MHKKSLKKFGYATQDNDIIPVICSFRNLDAKLSSQVEQSRDLDFILLGREQLKRLYGPTLFNRYQFMQRSHGYLTLNEIIKISTGEYNSTFIHSQLQFRGIKVTSQENQVISAIVID